jgi:hypothetical protein
LGAEEYEPGDLKHMLIPIKFRPRTRTGPVPNEGRSVWDQLENSMRNQFPNPHRRGCPDREVLENIASRTLSLSQAEPWLDHLGRCSPCFRDFEAIRAQRARIRRLAWVSAVAACLLVFVAVVFKVSSDRRASQRADSPQPLAPATPPITQPQVATLNFEQLSMTRAMEPDSSPQHLSRAQLSISIYLPAGSQPGTYDLQFLVNPADREALASTQGPAQRVNGVTLLRIKVDLSHFDPGTYVIAFRPAGGSWQYSRVEIS